MPSPDSSRRPTALVALAALLVLAAGLALAWRQWQASHVPAESRPPGAPADALPDTATADTSDAIVGQALAQIPAEVDSAAIKMRWTEDVKGAEYADLTPERRELFVRFANAERCTCGCGYTLAACRTYDSTCPTSGPMVQSLLDSVRAGMVRNARGIRARPLRGGG